MTDTQEQDPSIEEILASIRQIISDDDEEGAPQEEAPELTQPESSPESEIEALPEESDPEEVFELTEAMQSEEASFEAPSTDLMSKVSDTVEEEIFTETAADATVGAFSKLSESIALSTYSSDVTLEDIVKDMLRPMLREWIDSNMPRIVEVLVEKELEKLARHAKDS